MPKATEIRYWPSRKGGGYFCNYKRKQHELALGPKDGPTGPTYLRAIDAFKALLEAKPEPAPPPSPAGKTVRIDVYNFLEHMEKPRRQNRKKEQKRRAPVGWGAGSKRNCVTGLLAAFNWARKSKLISENPIEGIEKDAATSRGAETLIGNNAAEIEANHQKILAASPPPYRPFIQALKDSDRGQTHSCQTPTATARTQAPAGDYEATHLP